MNIESPLQRRPRF